MSGDENGGGGGTVMGKKLEFQRILKYTSRWHNCCFFILHKKRRR